MIAPRPGSISILAVASLLCFVGGCGGSNEDAGAEADEILKDLKALKPGEILIQGQRREKFSGPYTLRRGGYVLQFQREGDGNLTVALESRRGSKQPPVSGPARGFRAEGGPSRGHAEREVLRPHYEHR